MNYTKVRCPRHPINCTYPGTVAVIIYKYQGKMCAAGHPGRSREGVMQLYEQTLWADKEIKQKYKEMPGVFQEMKNTSDENPPHFHKLSSTQLLSPVHKVDFNKVVIRAL